MRLIKSLLVMTAVVGLVAIMGARSFAGPLPSFPSVWNVGDYVAGQSTLGGTTANPAEDIEIDWVVMFLGPAPANPFGIPVGAPVWGYYYQVENSSPTVVGRFVVTTPGPPFVFATSVFGDLDTGLVGGDPLTTLNIPAHSIAGETELATGGIRVATTTELFPSSVRWNFLTPPSGPGPIPINWESEILLAYALVPPTYGNASAIDDIPPSPWSSLAARGEPVPIPSPEPSAMVLLGMGMLAGIMMRRLKALK